MTWWGWMILGAFLFGSELFAIDAQFYLVFLGVSAMLVGVADLLGIAMPEWVQWLVFAALSLISMFTFRKSLYDKIRGDVPGFKEGVAGDHVQIDAELAPGTDSRTQFRGTDWTVLNVGSKTITAGTRAKIVKADGLTLHVSID
jgi:membrane protein implicated in regulation of membrane protease activity